jgi:protein-S-isoprenylcysteine O-methyltransferase Ste14
MIGRGLLRHGHQVVVTVVAVVLTLALVRQFASAGHPEHAVAFVLILGYLGWLVSETPITFGRRAARAPTDRTLLPYAAARAVTVIAAVLSPLPSTAWAWCMAGTVALFAGGIALRWWAIKVLGRFYSHQVIRHQGHSVVTDGPYARLRHPAYTGMLSANAGFVAYFASVFSLMGLVMLAAVLIWRIFTEERVLMTVPGYASYADGTARLLPGVW